MTKNKSKDSRSIAHVPLLVALGVAGGILLGASLNNQPVGNSAYSSLAKFREVVSNIEENYVDQVDTEALVDDAINHMLEKLDPHSVYLPKEEQEIARAQLEGQFEGIGIEFNLIRDTIYVVAALEGGPSEQAGLLPGDRIVQVDGETIAGTNLSNMDVIKLLRGKKGTKVNLGIQRDQANKLLTYTVVRDKIPQKSLAASYMIDEQTGYIKLSRFAATTYDEFKEALDKLQAQGMQRLVLDLQDNPGGYLDRAVKIADEFLSGDKMIVYTDGQQSRFDDQARAERQGSFEEQPLIVLLNEGSASASEVVAGALQDHDRALIVGRRSFGKGLVQMPIGLSDGSELRLTISRYYTPSGRSIQKPYDEGSGYRNELAERYNHGEFFSADSIQFSDSLAYKTQKGRTVYGGGGIMPDVFVALDTTQSSMYLNELYANNALREYTLRYAKDQREALEAMTFEDYSANFVVTEAMLDQLVSLAEENGLSRDAKGLERSKERIRNQVKALIARSIWGSDAFYAILNQQNASYRRALTLFDQARELAFNP